MSDANPDATVEGTDGRSAGSGEESTASTGVDTGTAGTSADAVAGEGSTATRLRRGVNYAVLAGLCLLALVAGVGFYTAALSTISQWVAAEYVSGFRALFNLAVLLLAGLGVSVQLRRLR